jgi:decaprenyl-phosphate phosphoribosyltransferase
LSGSMRALVIGLVRAARPKQWAKNLLVVAAPGAAGVLGHGSILISVALAVASFCCVASGTYLLNDVSDIESDRRHPLKCQRPIAAGVVSKPVAIGVGVGLVVSGFVLAGIVNWKLLGLLAAYAAVTTSYTLFLKHLPVVDMAVVAFGFMIRAAAGGVAAGVPMSKWFLIVASLGSLFMVAGKRHGEYHEMGSDGAAVRPALGSYSHRFLRAAWMVAACGTIIAYAVWAFKQPLHSLPWSELSIIPFVASVGRYALLLRDGRGSEPENLLLDDRILQLLGVLWVGLFVYGIYLGG